MPYAQWCSKVVNPCMREKLNVTYLNRLQKLSLHSSTELRICCQVRGFGICLSSSQSSLLKGHGLPTDIPRYSSGQRNHEGTESTHKEVALERIGGPSPAARL